MRAIAKLDLRPGEYGDVGDWAGPGEADQLFLSAVLDRGPSSGYGEWRSPLDSMALVATEVRGA